VNARNALKELTRLLRPRRDAGQAAVLALGEAKRQGQATVDNDSLGSFTQVMITFGSGEFSLEVICQDKDTLASGQGQA
jgi:hypothetical protein